MSVHPTLILVRPCLALLGLVRARYPAVLGGSFHLILTASKRDPAGTRLAAPSHAC